jgi:hypothetical protein
MDREKTKSTHKRLLNTSNKEKVQNVNVNTNEKVQNVNVNTKKDDKLARKNFISIKKMQEDDPSYNQFSVLSNLN